MTSLRRYLPLLGVGLLLVAAALAALLATPQVRPVKPLKPDLPTVEPTVFSTVRRVDPAAPAATAQPDPSQVKLPGWLLGAVQVLCVLVSVGLVVLVLWMMLRNRLGTRERSLPGTKEPETAARQDVIAALDRGLSELDDSDTDPRRAVIACWVRLEQAAAGAGTPRAPGDTSTDLVGRLLAEQHVSAAVLFPLAEVYRLARYATHTVDATMRDQARAALGQLRAELSRTAHLAAAGTRTDRSGTPTDRSGTPTDGLGTPTDRSAPRRTPS